MKTKILKNRTGLTTVSPYSSEDFILSALLVAFCSTIHKCNFRLIENVFDYSEMAERMKIRNRPNIEHLANMMKVCIEFYGFLDSLLAKGALTNEDIDSLSITSFYRTPKTNMFVGGSSTSLHQYGLAIDVDGSQKALTTIYKYLSVLFLKAVPQTTSHGKIYPFELIKYYKVDENRIEWLHIGYKYIVPVKNVLPELLPF